MIGIILTLRYRSQIIRLPSISRKRSSSSLIEDGFFVYGLGPDEDIGYFVGYFFGGVHFDYIR